MKKADYIILSGLLLLGILLTFIIFRPSGNKPAMLEVRQNGSLLMTFPLTDNITKTIEDKNGSKNVFTIQDGIVTMTEANCGDHTCIQTGKIANTGESIVCLPHRLVLQIVSEQESDELIPDAVVH